MIQYIYLNHLLFILKYASLFLSQRNFERKGAEDLLHSTNGGLDANLV